MTLKDLWARFEVIYSFNAAKNGEIKLSNDSDACTVARCIIGLRIHAMVHLLTYLLTYTVGSGSIKPAISPKRSKIERKLLLTSSSLDKVVHGLSIAAKVYDLEWPLREIQGHWFLKCHKYDEIQLSNDWLRRHVQWLDALYLLGVRRH